MRLRDVQITVKMGEGGEFGAMAYGTPKSHDGGGYRHAIAHLIVDVHGRVLRATFGYTCGEEHVQLTMKGETPRTSLMTRWAYCEAWFSDAPTHQDLDELLSRMEDEARATAKRWLEATRRADA